MATLILLRHGRTTANASGVLAGRTPGVRLDERGMEQAERAGTRLAAIPLAGVWTSPQERCKQTAQAVVGAQRAAGHPVHRARTDKALSECDYGAWQGQSIKTLLKDPLWRTVQQQPSAVTFPEGESMATMQHRAVSAVRRLDATVSAAHGADAVWVAVSHGDIIKAVLADAYGMHLDLFQRIHVDPASISIVHYAPDRPYVQATNTHEGDLAWLAAPARPGGVVGGGSGPAD